ncbi:MAG: class C sortase [Corynebacterium sp.]|uniref:class C sortase n=1 Tax=Corynebacterium sp. TaxID=1720 RepID=UPI0026E01E82|nr:class C sortase [Corynebacterium sp.]MDO5670428.1 class C sortase [Corynebacterium sp.]
MTHALITKPQPSAGGAAKRRKLIITMLLILAGVAILIYPVVATQYNNVKQTEFARQYNSNLKTFSTEELEANLAQAREYNATLPGIPILDPWLKIAEDLPRSQAYDEYLSYLALTDVMARVRVPSANIDLPIRHGTTDEVIENGAGHLYGTGLPVGGEGNHPVITSHSGMPYATLFDNLTKVKEGDLMFIEVNNETLAYQVDEINVVLPNETEKLNREEGRDLLTLFTCTPYGINTHRLLVRGERVEYTPEMENQLNEKIPFRIEPWMWIFLGAALLSLLALLWVVRRERKRRMQRAAFDMEVENEI